MLYSYNKYKLILEDASKDAKINKVKEKIKKFAINPLVSDWAIKKCISRESLNGLQYAVWVANQLKDSIVNGIMDIDNNVTEKEAIDFLKTEKSEKIKDSIILNFHSIDDFYFGYQETITDEIDYILDWLKSPLRTEKVNLSELTLNKAYEKSEEWHNSLKATGKIEDESGKVLIEFEDGYYWIDLESTYCEAEAKAMGHCGRTGKGDTLLSLRDNTKEPHVTVAYDTEKGIIYQMKGKNNNKPIQKYFPYIYRLLIDPNLKIKKFGYEYNKAEDFNLLDFDKETFKKVYDYNPDLIYNSLEDDYRLISELYNKEIIDKEQIIQALKNSKNGILEIMFELIENQIFTKEEIKDIIKENKIPIDNIISTNFDEYQTHYGDLAYLKAYKYKLIKPETLVHKFKDELIIENDTMYIDASENDLDSFMDETVQTILFGDGDIYESDWFDVIVSNYWYMFTNETKKMIADKMIGETFELSSEKGNIEISENMIVFETNDWVIKYDDEHYDIEHILDRNKNSEIYDAINRACNYAQDDANNSEYYRSAQNALENILGSFKRTERKITYFSMNKEKTEYREMFRFELDDVFDFKYYISELEQEYLYDNKIDYTEDNYNGLWNIIENYNNEKAEINDNYGLFGDIDKKDLNDRIQDEIHFIKK